MKKIVLMMLIASISMNAQTVIKTDPEKDLAESGNMVAQYNLGLSYYTGKGRDVDYDKAFRLISESAKQGYIQAYSLLASFYEEGIGTKVDYSKAEYWYKEGVKLNDKYCKYNLGGLYTFNDKEEPKKIEEGIALLMEFANQGDSGAMNMIGNGYNNLRKNDLAIVWYTKAADKGYLGAAVALGALYLKGHNEFPIDFNKAIQWNNHVINSGIVDKRHLNLAKHNLPIAQYKAGELLFEQKKYDEAIILFMRAASNEDNPIPEAMRKLSAYFRYGLGGIEKDATKEKYYMEEAAKYKDEVAMRILGI